MPDTRPLGTPDPDRIVEDTGDAYAESLTKLRSDLGLDQPYGEQAVALKIGPLRPIPSPAAASEEDPTAVLTPEPPGHGTPRLAPVRRRGWPDRRAYDYLSA